MLTIKALAAADSVIIPVQAEYLPVKGLEQLLQTIVRVNKQINPRLVIDGILLTMVDRTNDAKDVIATLKQGKKIRSAPVKNTHKRLLQMGSVRMPVAV